MKVSFVLCVLLFCIASLQLAGDKLDREAESFQIVRVHSQNAIDQTKIKIAHTLQLLIKDRAFSYALGEQQTHSINQLNVYKVKIQNQLI